MFPTCHCLFHLVIMWGEAAKLINMQLLGGKVGLSQYETPGWERNLDNVYIEWNKLVTVKLVYRQLVSSLVRGLLYSWAKTGIKCLQIISFGQTCNERAHNSFNSPFETDFVCLFRSLWSDETKIELFGHSDHRKVWTPRTLYLVLNRVMWKMRWGCYSTLQQWME